jgi:hypothetical protein
VVEVEATAGELRPRFSAAIDLCLDCGGGFTDWLRRGRDDSRAEVTGGVAFPWTRRQ